MMRIDLARMNVEDYRPPFTQNFASHPVNQEARKQPQVSASEKAQPAAPYACHADGELDQTLGTNGYSIRRTRSAVQAAMRPRRWKNGGVVPIACTSEGRKEPGRLLRYREAGGPVPCNATSAEILEDLLRP